MNRSFIVAGLAAAGIVGGLAIAQPGLGDHALAAASALGISPAMAQDGGPRGERGEHHWGRHGHRGGGLERVCSPNRAERLEDMIVVAERRLELKPEQRGAWTNLTTALRQASARVGQTCESVKAGGEAATAPARLARMETIAKTGTETIQSVRPSFDAFYASLNADQKAKVDALVSRHGPRR